MIAGLEERQGQWFWILVVVLGDLRENDIAYSLAAYGVDDVSEKLLFKFGDSAFHRFQL